MSSCGVLLCWLMVIWLFVRFGFFIVLIVVSMWDGCRVLVKRVSMMMGIELSGWCSRNLLV